MKATLPLSGGRKKATRKPRTEGVMLPANRACYYARLYPPGAKRARYIATHTREVQRAEELLPHLRALAARGHTVSTAAINQPELFSLNSQPSTLNQP